MLNKLAKLASIKVVTDEQLQEMTLAMSSLDKPEGERAALLDSGASHSFRLPVNMDEETSAMPVKVELAGGQYITLKQNRAGTLLSTRDVEGAVDSTPILPLGALVQQLGCDLSWSRKTGLKVSHPQFGELRTFVRGNHPMIGETQALALIAQLEEAKLKELENKYCGDLREADGCGAGKGVGCMHGQVRADRPTESRVGVLGVGLLANGAHELGDGINSGNRCADGSEKCVELPQGSPHPTLLEKVYDGEALGCASLCTRGRRGD